MLASAGQCDQVVLSAILTLRDDAYGVSIHGKALQLAAPQRVSPGSVYVTLDSLEDRGFISSWLSDPTPERGGRSKRFYRLEALGERALEESAATENRIANMVAEIWGDLARELGRRPRWSPVRPK